MMPLFLAVSYASCASSMSSEQFAARVQTGSYPSLKTIVSSQTPSFPFKPRSKSDFKRPHSACPSMSPSTGLE